MRSAYDRLPHAFFRFQLFLALGGTDASDRLNAADAAVDVVSVEPPPTTMAWLPGTGFSSTDAVVADEVAADDDDDDRGTDGVLELTAPSSQSIDHNPTHTVVQIQTINDDDGPKTSDVQGGESECEEFQRISR